MKSRMLVVAGLVALFFAAGAVARAAATDYTISVEATGLSGTLVVTDNQSDTLTFTTNETLKFATPYASGATYAVSIETQPAGQTCTLSTNATGTITKNLTVTATCKTDYTVSVAVTGLTGTLVMKDNENDTLDFTTNDTQTFANQYTSGSSYTVSVKTQPSGETCTLSSNAKGKITSDTTVTATCVPNYKISVTVTGLSGTLVVEDNQSNELTFAKNITKSFSKLYPGGSTYSVTVETQPVGETCALSSNSSGIITSNITVTATCGATAYTISAAVSGLTGTNQGLVLQDNGTSNLTIPSNGTYPFSTQIAAGGAYNVTVFTQPSGESCTVTNPSGTANSNVTVSVSCSPIMYTISASVTGLTGTNQGLVLQDNGTSNLTVPSNGTYPFTTTIAAGGAYNVTVFTQPSGESCTVSNPTGTANSNVTVSVSCSPIMYTISASVTGLTGTNQGLVLQDNGTSNLTVPSNGTYPFTTTIAAGGAYNVTVFTQPSGESCTVTNPTGTANSNVTVSISCSPIMYTISAAVTGLTGTNQGLVLQDNGTSNLSVPSNGTYPFVTKIAAGGAYNVTVFTQPSGENCTVTNPTGTANSNVTITVSCAPIMYTISAAVTGLTGTNQGLVLQDNGTSNLTIPSNGTYPFVTKIAAGGAYNVTVFTQPSGESCTVTNPTGTANSNVTVSVSCAPIMYTISASVTGLTGTNQGLVLQDNGTSNLTIPSNGTYPFATTIAAGGAYNVTVFTQPSGESCTVTNPTGTANSNVTVSVSCAPIMYTISAAVTGLTGTNQGLVLQDNGTSNLTIPSNGTYPFVTKIAAGGAYNVTVFTQPSGESCTVTNPTGTANSNVTVSVSCAAIMYTISATVTGLTGTNQGLVLQDNGTSNLTIPSNGTYPFTTTIAAGGAYDVTVFTQPTGESCTVANPTGTANSNVTVTVSCAAIMYTISATVTGLTGTNQGLVLQDNGTSNMTIPSNGTYPFATTIAAGGAYNVTVFTQPSGQSCTVTNPTGTANSNVTVSVSCASIMYTISASVTGLTGTNQGLVLQDNGSSNLSVPSNGTYPFATTIAAGGAYDVTVFTQPSGENCTVTNPTGTANSNVTVAVSCTSVTYTISAVVTGLTGTNQGLVLQDNGSSNLSVPSNGTYPFATTIAAGGAYNVTVFTQPSGQNCRVPSPTGNANSNVTVSVTCSINLWTWVSGSNLAGQTGSYGTKGTPGGTPGSRYGSATWIDSSGTFWLFGGYGYDINGNENYLNDLWKFSAGQWTWVNGSNTIDQAGAYGTLGITSGTNVPGARAWGVSWKDLSGNFWLFGGYGIDSGTNDPAAPLNDLWEYKGNQWIWQGGSNISGQKGTYGTEGVGSSTNIPGGRYSASEATDAAGNFWLFGGVALDSTGNDGPINDLWEYSNGVWTWVSGANTIEQKGTYGGVGSVPGGREGQVSWIDSSGNFWMFAGNGADMNGSFGYLNDLWEYSGGVWTWLSGSDVINQPASYGTEGVPSSANVPGSREYSVGWLDKSGNFWMFGGQQVGDRELTDLWKYSGGEWTWVSGLDTANTLGTYGTLGTGAPSDTPGSRQLALGWIDASGNLWLFGGYGWASVGQPECLNDLWEYQP